MNGKTLFTDWKHYQLAMFNLIQNSIKFNNIRGKVIVSLSLKVNEGQIYNTLETKIEDTGLGIDEED